jgi:hypothetical protein
MDNGDNDLSSAVSLQVQAAWLRPNLLRLTQAWLLQAQVPHASKAMCVYVVWKWLYLQLAPAMHPLKTQLGTAGPAVAAAMAEVGNRRSVLDLQVN